eukprot:NODE_675_length_4834_cov_0.216895.p2 type:complete len:280 gc:universal NODE_675_length_4834_cov_0.216895:26-865(+)
MNDLMDYCVNQNCDNGFKWLKYLWKYKHHWVKSVYGSHVYSLGILTTQGGESLNAVVKMDVNGSTSILRCLKALESTSRRQTAQFVKELEVIVSQNSNVTVISPWGNELFKGQHCLFHTCTIHYVHDDYHYTIKQKSSFYEVKLKPHYYCSCNFPQLMDMLCVHQMKILLDIFRVDLLKFVPNNWYLTPVVENLNISMPVVNVVPTPIDDNEDCPLIISELISKNIYDIRTNCERVGLKSKEMDDVMMDVRSYALEKIKAKQKSKTKPKARKSKRKGKK